MQTKTTTTERFSFWVGKGFKGNYLIVYDKQRHAYASFVTEWKEAPNKVEALWSGLTIEEAFGKNGFREVELDEIFQGVF